MTLTLSWKTGVAAVVAIGAIWIGLHLYRDHQTFHRMIAWVNAADPILAKARGPVPPRAGQPIEAPK